MCGCLVDTAAAAAQAPSPEQLAAHLAAALHVHCLAAQQPGLQTRSVLKRTAAGHYYAIRRMHCCCRQLPTQAIPDTAQTAVSSSGGDLLPRNPTCQQQPNTTPNNPSTCQIMTCRTTPMPQAALPDTYIKAPMHHQSCKHAEPPCMLPAPEHPRAHSCA